MSLELVISDIIENTGRRDFETESGRIRLIRKINAAQVMLDADIVNFPKSDAVLTFTLFPGQYFLTFRYLLTLHHVTIATSEGLSEIDLHTYDYHNLRMLLGKDGNSIQSHDGTISFDGAGNGTGVGTTLDTDGVIAGSILVMPYVGGGVWLLVNTIADDTNFTVTQMDGSSYIGEDENQNFYAMGTGVTRGTPTYAALNRIRLAPGTMQPLPDLDTADLVGNSQIAYDGLLIYPPPSVESTIRITGRFISNPLSSGTDVSFWTEEMGGEALINKTQWLLEGSQMRNMTGAKGYDEIVEKVISGTKKTMIARRSDMIGSKIRRSVVNTRED